MAESRYPKFNDKEWDLLKVIAWNTAVITDEEAGDVASVAGTANQVLVNGGTAAATGVITLSLPQSIATTSSPTFANATFSDRTSGRVAFYGVGGVLSDAASLAFNSGTGILTATGFAGALNGTVGATTPAAGTFTSVIATGNSAFNVAAGITPFVELEVDSTSTSSPRGIMTAQFNTGTDGARFHMRKARGTRAAPTTVVVGDNLGRLVATGYDGTNYLEMGSIIFGTEGTIAATRVPTNISFWTATNAAPSVLTLAATINSSQQFVNNVGTAGAPSYTFTGSTDAGFYSSAAHVVNFAANGTNLLKLSGNGSNDFSFTFPANSSGSSATITAFAAGGITATAGGTNQSITLTPSGTGMTKFVGANGTPRLAYIGDYSADNTYSALYLGLTGAVSSTNPAIISNGSSVFLNAASAAGEVSFLQANVRKVVIAPTTGNLLLGGLSTDGTGVLQFPAATTSAGGITFGTDTNLYRNSGSGGLTIFKANDGQLTLDNTAAQTYTSLYWANGGTVKAQAFFNLGTVTLTVGTVVANGITSLVSGNGTTALTLDSSQNATFAGTIKTSAPTTGTAGAWKLGIRVAATVVLDTTQYIQLDVGGTLYKLAIAS